MRVMKFGGSSLADPEKIAAVAEIVRRNISVHPGLIVVVSAQSGVTDNLVRLCSMIPEDQPGSESMITALEDRHLSAIRALLPVAELPSAIAEIISLCNELSDIVKGSFLVGEVTDRTSDMILSFGERLSAFVVYQVLKRSAPGAIYTDARELIKTDQAFGKAKIDFTVTNRLIREYCNKRKGLKIVTGFIASSSEGNTTILGRNGSDYTASVFGAAVDAEAIEIWTDTDGVMTADPSLVADARSISQLSYNEAMELSHFGAKVLFPASLNPAMAKKIPVIVKNTFNPDHIGTLISAESNSDNGFFKGITSLGNICMITVEGSGMVGVAGISARLFTALWQGNISVILISQASSEHSICIAVLHVDSEKANTLLNDTFSDELESGMISSVLSECGLAVVAVVGERMRHTPGVAGRVFTPLGRKGINIKAICQGSSERNISFVISENDLKYTLCLLHNSFFKRKVRL